MVRNKPVASESPVVITAGDPAGIGPEVIAKALASMRAPERRAMQVVGTIPVLERAARLVDAPLTFVPVGCRRRGDEVEVHHVELAGPPPPFGKLDAGGGDAAYRYVSEAVRLTAAGETAAVVTAPLNKEALNAAGHRYDGHTGLLAALTKSKSVFMLLTSERLSTIHATTHVALRDVSARVTAARVLETIEAAWLHWRRLGIEAPRIAVAGLNPHTGEDGLFGDEDRTQVAPAVAQARSRGMDAEGPLPGHTVFGEAFRGRFDVVVAQYHDQGHIPMNMVAAERTVNVSLGLPFDRTSVEHGTAFDIAGTGRARHENMLGAILYARRLVATRHGRRQAEPAGFCGGAA